MLFQGVYIIYLPKYAIKICIKKDTWLYHTVRKFSQSLVRFNMCQESAAYTYFTVSSLVWSHHCFQSLQARAIWFHPYFDIVKDVTNNKIYTASILVYCSNKPLEHTPVANLHSLFYLKLRVDIQTHGKTIIFWFIFILVNFNEIELYWNIILRYWTAKLKQV